MAFTVPLTLTVTTDADQDIFELVAPSTNKLELLEFGLSSMHEASEAVHLRLTRATTAGTGGSAATEVKNDEDDGDIIGSVNTLVTSPGTPTAILMSWAWEQLGEKGKVWTPRTTLKVPKSGYLKLNLQTAMAASREWRGWVTWGAL